MLIVEIVAFQRHVGSVPFDSLDCFRLARHVIPSEGASRLAHAKNVTVAEVLEKRNGQQLCWEVNLKP